MQPMGAAFALKEGRARCLVAGAVVAQVVGAGYIICVQFRVADAVEDV